jgi:hypothetical protein
LLGVWNEPGEANASHAADILTQERSEIGQRLAFIRERGCAVVPSVRSWKPRPSRRKEVTEQPTLTVPAASCDAAASAFI